MSLLEDTWIMDSRPSSADSVPGFPENFKFGQYEQDPRQEKNKTNHHWDVLKAVLSLCSEPRKKKAGSFDSKESISQSKYNSRRPI